MTHSTPAVARPAWSPGRGEIAVFLVAIVVIVSDMPEPIPFWPLNWGHAPSVGTVLLVAALALALSRFGREQWDKAA